MEINLDFDGTCVKHEFPEIGADIGAVPVLKKIVEKGHRLILFTMRSDYYKVDGSLVTPGSKEVEDHLDSLMGSDSGPSVEKFTYLSDSLKWFKDNNIPVYGIQSNPTQKNWTVSPKSYAPLMIDDSSLGCPMVYPKNGRPYVDWNQVEKMLIEKGIL